MRRAARRLAERKIVVLDYVDGRLALASSG
jgi:hypothetical protein